MSVMPFSFVLIIAAVIGLVVVFGVTYARNGLRTALIATAAALVVFFILYVAIVTVIVSMMQ